MRIEQGLVLFLLLIVFGILFEGIASQWYYKNKKKSIRRHFHLIRYMYFILFPLFVGILVSIYIGGLTAFKAFVIFASLGPVCEWGIGFSYQAIVGQKLWTYHRYSIAGNTSLLAIPFWGFAGVLFYYLARIIN